MASIDCRRIAIVLTLFWGGGLGCFGAPIQTTEHATSEATDLAELCRREVIDLHRFIEDWSNGQLEDNDSIYRRFADSLASDFVLIGPDGEVADRAGTVDGFRGAHGRWRDGTSHDVAEGAANEDDPEGGRIEIRNLSVRALNDPLCLIAYEEWHFVRQSARGRISTVLLRRSDQAPGGVEWAHLHEVWLP